MSDDRERELFEAAMRQPPMQWGDKDFGLGWATDTYARYETLCAWDGWRLGRAALRAELADTVAVPREPQQIAQYALCGGSHVFADMLEDGYEALRLAGGGARGEGE